MKGPISTVVAATPVKAGITFKDVGKVLSEQRKRIGLNQGDIAKQLKYVNINFISMLESGKSKIPVNKIDELVAAYQLPPEFILVALQAEYPDYLGTILRLAKKTPLIFKDVVNDPTARIDRIYQMTLDSLRTR